MEQALQQVTLEIAPIKAVTELVRNTSMLRTPDVFVKLWQAELDRRVGIGQEVLPLVYCANDVLQETKADVGDAFAVAFADTLRTSLKLVVDTFPDIVPKVVKTMRIWHARAVFTTEQLVRMAQHMGMYELSGEFEVRPLQEDGGGGDGEDTMDDNVRETPEQLEAQKRSDIKQVLKTMSLGELAMASKWMHDGLDSTALSDARNFVHHPNGELSNFLAQVATDAAPAHKMPEMNQNIRDRLMKLRSKRAALMSHEFVKARVLEALDAEEMTATTRMEAAAGSLSMSQQMQDAVDTLKGYGYEDDEPIKVQSTTWRTTVKYRMGIDPKQREMQIAAQVEAAKKADEEKLKSMPMVYDKVRRKYVPLPSANQAESWRE